MACTCPTELPPPSVGAFNESIYIILNCPDHGVLARAPGGDSRPSRCSRPSGT